LTALQLGNKVGTFQSGKEADFIVIDTGRGEGAFKSKSYALIPNPSPASGRRELLNLDGTALHLYIRRTSLH
jgi:predicted amidohydrolase YtcJ